MSVPEPGVIVFDGVCVLCSASVQFVLRHDRARRFKFATVQSNTGRALLHSHGIDPANPMSFLLVQDGRAFTESDAMLRVGEGFGGAWRLAAIGRVVPRFLRDAAYRFVARNRYRWFGQRDTCLMPTPELKERFLD